MGERMARRQRTSRRRRTLAVGAGAIVAVVGGGAAWAMSGSDAPAYRLAAVNRSDISQTVTSTGTVASVDNATLRFPVSGRVASVRFGVGDTVRAGQTVATLDTTALKQALQDAKAQAATARQTLADDASGQTSGNGSDSSSPTSDGHQSDSLAATPLTSPTPTSSGTKAPSTSSPSTADLIAAVRRAQQKVIADQHTADVDADLAAADKAIVAENAACAALLSDSSSSTSSATASGSPTSTSDPAADLQVCQDAIAAVQAAQKQVQTDLHTLIADEAQLDQAISALLAALGQQPPASNNQSSGANRPSSSPTNDGSSSGDGSSSTVASAAQLAADQKRVDAADAQVDLAQQNLDQATLATPISGTVAAVSLTAGQDVAAGSTTATITVVGRGQKAVHATVTLAELDLVKKGQTATVTVDGVTKPITGHVTLIGAVNTSGTSGSTATYPVTIVLDTDLALYDGAGATASVAVGTAHNVLTVPTSAVHKSGTAYTVTLYRNGKTSTQRVTLGARSTDLVEIRTGLSEGDQVVLADLHAAIPTSNNQNGRFGRNGGGLGNIGGGPVVVGGPKGGR